MAWCAVNVYLVCLLCCDPESISVTTVLVVRVQLYQEWTVLLRACTSASIHALLPLLPWPLPRQAPLRQKAEMATEANLAKLHARALVESELPPTHSRDLVPSQPNLLVAIDDLGRLLYNLACRLLVS